MTKEKLLDAFAEIDARYIAEAVGANGIARRLRRFAALAACICLVAVAAFFLRTPRAPVIIEENGFYIENGVLLSYSGTESEIVLPEAVTEVADNAFANAPAVESITLSANVETLNVNSFAGLEQLGELVLADASTAFVEREDTIFTFDGSMIIYYKGSAEHYTVPAGVKYIGAHAFQNKPLVTVDFGNTLEYIGYNAFAGCSALTAIYLPESIVRLDEGAFADCIRAVDGYIPSHVEMDDSTFFGVPFYLSLLAGQISPMEQIMRGEISPSEAILGVETEYLTKQINYILYWYGQTHLKPSDIEKGTDTRLQSAARSQLPKEAVLPDVWTYADLTANDNGWGGMGIRDVQLRLPLGDRCTMVMEAYLYGGGQDILRWSDAKWRIELVMFVIEEAEPNYGDWQVTQEWDSSLTFYNTVTGAAVNSGILQDRSREYYLTFSPAGTRCAIEYERPEYGRSLFVLPLNGESINHSQTVIYMNRYFGQYTPSSCYWSDENTLCGENEYGEFAWNIYEVYPKQITDSRAERSEALTQELLLGYVGNDRITITVPECWENIGYFEDGHRTAEYPGEATRMPCTPGIGLLQDYYHGGAWDIQKIADVHDLYYYKEDLETLVDTEEMYVGRYKGYAVPPDPFTERGEPVTFSYPALIRVGDRVVVVKIIAYPEDPDGYYENTVLPILQSVCLHVGEGPLRITPVEDSLDGRFYTEFLLSYHGRQTQEYKEGKMAVAEILFDKGA